MPERRRFPACSVSTTRSCPQLEAALLAGHDFVLLGERGQGKTRLMRSLVALLDEWSPVVEGCEINDDPLAPVCVRCRRLSAELGDDLPVTWRHRDDRYVEKLATPDTSVGDLVGDVDPVKVASGRTLGDPETIHYGLLPRSNRGVFALNELPDLAERIQVAMFNVLEERDIQVRGYSLRLPLDVLVVATANPEDYTNRGRIITPLKDRFGAEIRTHYPFEVEEEMALIAQEAELVAVVPEHLLEVVARLTRGLRQSSAVDQRSGVSARFAIAAAEAVAASALRRGARVGEAEPVARICDVPPVVPTLLGKVEFEMGEEEREVEVVQHLLRVATAETFRARLCGTRPVRLHGSLRRGRDGRDRGAGAGERAARPGRHRPRSVQGPGPARTWRRCEPRSGRSGHRAGPRGAASHPADRQGGVGRPRGVRGLTMAAGRYPLQPLAWWARPTRTAVRRTGGARRGRS